MIVRSFRPDARQADHLAPLLDLGRHIGAELVGGEEYRRGGDVGEPRARRRGRPPRDAARVAPPGDSPPPPPPAGGAPPRNSLRAPPLSRRWSARQAARRIGACRPCPTHAASPIARARASPSIRRRQPVF